MTEPAPLSRDPHRVVVAPGQARVHPPPAVGERLGVWRIVAPLFECASGQWFRVEHALAVTQSGLALVYRHEGDAQAVLMRFAEDSDALSRFGHPSHGAPLDSGLSPAGAPYLVVPPMEGAPLMRVAMALPLRRRMELLLDLIGLLDAAHEQHLRLQELDPGMLWLSPSQQLHWLGQGLSPRDSQAPAALVRAAEPLAHARQLAGGRPDAATEAYALGRLLGLLVNGRLPRREGVPDEGRSVDEAEAGAAPVASLQSWLSLTAAQRESLDQLLDKAMMDGRSFADRRLLAQAVREWLDTPVSARTAAASAPMPLAPLTPPPPLPEDRPTTPPAASMAERLAIACVLAALTVVVWLMMRPG